MDRYNASKRDRNEHLDLETYTLDDLDKAIAEIHGDRSARAKPAGKRKAIDLDDDALLPESDKRSHLITAVPSEGTHYCKFRRCPWAAQNKAQKCGEGMKNQQAGRSSCKKNGVLCLTCGLTFHVECYSLYHRCACSLAELEPPERKKRKRAATSKSKTSQSKKAKASAGAASTSAGVCDWVSVVGAGCPCQELPLSGLQVTRTKKTRTTRTTTSSSTTTKKISATTTKTPLPRHTSAPWSDLCSARARAEA